MIHSEYGCTIENTNKAIEKAKSKGDGFYTVKGMGYRVVDGCVTHVADNNGILERFGNFNVKVGELKGNSSKSKGQLLKEAFKRGKL